MEYLNVSATWAVAAKKRCSSKDSGKCEISKNCLLQQMSVYFDVKHVKLWIERLLRKLSG